MTTLTFVAARARRNTRLAAASDLKIFFEVVGKPPAAVSADVFAFLSEQRAPRRGERVVRIEDGDTGLAARTIALRLSSVRGLYAYLAAHGDTGVTRNPVPTSLAAPSRCSPGPGRGAAGPHAADVAAGAVTGRGRRIAGGLRTRRDRAMVEAMVLGGLRGHLNDAIGDLAGCCEQGRAVRGGRAAG